MQKSCSPVAHSRRALGRRVAREPGAVEAWVNDEWLDGPSGRGVGMRPKGLVGWTSNWSVSLLGQNLGSPRPTWTTAGSASVYTAGKTTEAHAETTLHLWYGDFHSRLNRKVKTWGGYVDRTTAAVQAAREWAAIRFFVVYEWYAVDQL